MCWCRPEVRTPFCGRPECVPPGSSYRVPISPELKTKMNVLADRITGTLPPGVGFGLFIFSTGPDQTCTWISNVKRDDVVKALQEWMRVEGS